MNAELQGASSKMTARGRLLSAKGDPFLFADWSQALFMHYRVAPECLNANLPSGLELELFEGSAYVSVVALTMRNFRPCRLNPAAWILKPIKQQRFLNVRTYVRCGDEPGAFFLWGWLSQPFIAGLPSGLFGLPYGFARLDYQNGLPNGVIRGEVIDSTNQRFAYHADPGLNSEMPKPCEPGSLAEFAMERYTGFFSSSPKLFRVWHPPWLQKPIDVSIEHTSLLSARFPWITKATLAGANLAFAIDGVWMGRAHRVKLPAQRPLRRRHVLSSFYDMP